MKKQIIYPKFIDRIFALTLDFFILSIITMLITSFCSLPLFIFVVNVIILVCYFIGFWIYKGTTPGKIIMHMKIVDAVTFLQPTNGQLIKRFCYCISIFFGGSLFILFTKKRQALHDKIVGTLVIKS